LATPAHVDAAGNLVLVINVQRPAHLEHDEIGDVDER
jgi:hypothetical protein